MSPRTLSPVTEAVQAGLTSDRHHGAVVPPLHLSSNFTFDGLGGKREYDYTRSGNPTRDLLGDALARLEKGAGAVVTSSGMSAVAVVLNLLEPGDLVIAPQDCYGGTFRLLSALAARGHFLLEYIDPTDPAELAAALDRGPRMVWVETPSNPLLRLTDVRRVVAGARAVGALVVVDNTFLSPALQRPLELGADVVVHSTTKYLNGHSDVVGGAVVCRCPDLHERVSWWANALGATGSPFDSFLTLRGIRTLHARMAQHERNAGEAARLLAPHPAVSRVYYPGLPEHPGHAIAVEQQDGFGGMVSFELRGGEAAVHAFLDGLQCFILAESLGGVESLVSHPTTMTHASMTEEGRRQAGIGPNLLRLSLGIEGTEDLRDDLSRALERALAQTPVQEAVA